MNAPELSFVTKDLGDLQIAHQVDVDPFTGNAVVEVPLPSTPGRSGTGPSLSLRYNSSAGSSVYGAGWSLSGIPTIGLTSKRHPRYDGSDDIVFNGSLELVPFHEHNGATWVPRVDDSLDSAYRIDYFRSKYGFTRIRFERWVHKSTGRVHWRTRDENNLLSVYGLTETGQSRLYDPDDPNRVYLWLLEAQYDTNGNATFYEYQVEDTEDVDTSTAYERVRARRGKPYPQRYLKRILYGNTRPISPDLPLPSDNQWLFEVVLDYGDHLDARFPSPVADGTWTARPDPYSSYRPGFEVRTYRLCRRVLMFHRFPEVFEEDATLVWSMRFDHRLDPLGSTLEALHYTGYRHDPETDAVSEKSLMPLRFDYSQPRVGDGFRPAPQRTKENAPAGLGDLRCRWVDLYGEGLPGLLTETNQAWYYKPNLGGGELGPQLRVAAKPSQRVGSYALTDFDRDGNLNLAVLEGRQAGYCEYDRDAEKWRSFQPFGSAPHLDSAGTRAQWLDLNGDGLPDILISEQDRFVWYPSEGKAGFGAPVELAKPSSRAQPQAITEDLDLELFFADMTGDGMLDQARIQNGRVEYWPALGRGRFGDTVQMAGAPVFDSQSEFDPARLRLADLDGSGTSDLLYIGRGEIRYWKNACGNGFVEDGRITDLPYIDNVSTVNVLDFLGNGTACLVWSTPLVNHAEEPIHYLELTDGVTPRLLLSVDNGMGRVIRLQYVSSGRDYLRDKHSGRGWVTKLPSHATVVECKDVIDQIGGSHLVTRFRYHDGYYDGEKREFRGFGLVDQFDTETLPTEEAPEALHTAPSCVRTWFHNGSCRPDVCATADCYGGDPDHRHLPAPVFDAPVPLAVEAIAEGYRALAGQAIRQEVYAVDPDDRLAEHPFQVIQNGYRLRLLQPVITGKDACVAFYPSETLTHEYEQAPEDPRISHQLVLTADDYGTPLETLAAGYPRRSDRADSLSLQQRRLLNATRESVVNIDTRDRFELALPTETRAFALTLPPPGNTGLYTLEGIRPTVGDALDTALDFHESLDRDAEIARARLVGWERSFYWNDTGTEALPFNEVGAPTLPHHTETASFDESTVSTLFADWVSDEMLVTGHYEFLDGYWWQSSPILHFADSDAFRSLVESERMDGTTRFAYDAHYLTLTEITDPRDNSTQAEIDYHLLAPNRLIDPNGTVSEVRYDPLGMTLIGTSHGTVIGHSGESQAYGNASLDEYATRPDPTLSEVIASPAQYLQDAGQFLSYDLASWQEAEQPLRSVSLVRERFARDTLEDGPAGHIQVVLTYVDGFGRTLQTKQRVESGLAIHRNEDGSVVLDEGGRPTMEHTDDRWRVSGHIAYNQKQQPVLQYEPYFSPSPDFEADAVLRTFGFATELRYDALGRQVRQFLPNGTFTKTEITPWEVRQYDPIDTLKEADAYTALLAMRSADDPERLALADTRLQAKTPTISRLDALGREIARIETDNAGPDRTTRNELDGQGNLVRIIDPRGLTAFEYDRDMQGRPLHEHGIDNGHTWSLPDALGRPFHQWDGRGIHQQITHDELDRPTSVHVDGTLDESRSLDNTVERLIYGDDPDYLGSAHQNARGRLVEHYDQAGRLVVHRYDTEGNPLETERQLLRLRERPPFDIEPDWSDLGTDTLERENGYVTRTDYDALGRVLRQTLPDQTTRSFLYLPSGGVTRVGVTSELAEFHDHAFLEEADYNARGQRTRALLGNGTLIAHGYDERTFRLQRLVTSRPARDRPGVSRTYQDIEYSYDPVGNITHMVDRAQQPDGVIRNLPRGLHVSSHSDYTYDAFYQLSSATGRVHQALEQHDYRPGSRADEPRMKGTRHLRLENGAAVERYKRTYSYDLSGNIQTIAHTASTDSAHSWTTDIWTSETSNRSLPDTDPNGADVTDPELRFDANGNCIAMPHLRRMGWNYRNNLSRAVLVERRDSELPDDAEYYIYGADGMRIRKIGVRLITGEREDTPDRVEVAEKIYLDGCEIKRVHRDGDLWLERASSHITDGSERIAIVHRWTQDRNHNETDVVGAAKIHYQLANHLGSASLELAPDGRVISYEEYFPFGGTAFIAGNNVKEVRIKEYRYSGKERDDSTGFYYYGYRYYAPWIGNWLSPDPIGPEDSLNLYQFVSNDPINRSDPYGLKDVPTESPTNIDNWTPNDEQQRERQRRIDERGRAGGNLLAQVLAVDPDVENAAREADQIVREAEEFCRSSQGCTGFSGTVTSGSINLSIETRYEQPSAESPRFIGEQREGGMVWLEVAEAETPTPPTTATPEQLGVEAISPAREEEQDTASAHGMLDETAETLETVALLEPWLDEKLKSQREAHPPTMTSGIGRTSANTKPRDATTSSVDWDSVLNVGSGLLMIVGGFGEAYIGVAGVFTPEFSTSILGAYMIYHGADLMSAGSIQIWRGEIQHTMTHQGTSDIAERYFGASHEQAESVAAGVELGLGVISGVGVGRGLMRVRFDPLTQVRMGAPAAMATTVSGESVNVGELATTAGDVQNVSGGRILYLVRVPGQITRPPTAGEFRLLRRSMRSRLRGVQSQPAPSGLLEQTTERIQPSKIEHVEIRTIAGLIRRYVGRRTNAPLPRGPDIARTTHTHPRYGVAMFSEIDIGAYSSGGFGPNTIHRVVGIKWPTAGRVAIQEGAAPIPLTLENTVVTEITQNMVLSGSVEKLRMAIPYIRK